MEDPLKGNYYYYYYYSKLRFSCLGQAVVVSRKLPHSQTSNGYPGFSFFDTATFRCGMSPLGDFLKRGYGALCC